MDVRHYFLFAITIMLIEKSAFIIYNLQNNYMINFSLGLEFILRFTNESDVILFILVTREFNSREYTCRIKMYIIL